jgi:uncharacterized protein YprB with RNaseH-like and TPR domain
MLQNTFLHLSGIGIKSEQSLWEKGIRSWDDFLAAEDIGSSRKKTERMKDLIKESQEQLQTGNMHYFAERFPQKQYWRFFPEFRDKTAYLSVETTALDPWLHSITVMTLYDGNQIVSYIQGKNLDDFEGDIRKYSLVITYNGRRVHLPFLGMYMGLKLKQVHIDLRYLLGSVGYTGGLRKCEEKIKIKRGDVKDVDGCTAVILWEEYRDNGNKKALDSLLAYSAYNSVNLEPLMIVAYNLKLDQTPFSKTKHISPPKIPKIPYEGDIDAIFDANESAITDERFPWKQYEMYRTSSIIY